MLLWPVRLACCLGRSERLRGFAMHLSLSRLSLCRFSFRRFAFSLCRLSLALPPAIAPSLEATLTY
eukprot:5968569-Heterocapsa_arctica.AAC.1